MDISASPKGYCSSPSSGDIEFYGTDATYGYMFHWAPTEGSATGAGSISWTTRCPLTSLPESYLALRHGSGSIYRRDGSGTWTEQYVASYIDSYYDSYYYAQLTQLYYLSSTAPISWSGWYYVR